MTYRSITTVVATVVSLAVTSTAMAAIVPIGPPVDLQTLLDTDGSVLAELPNGDKKEFSGFSYAATGDNPIAANINIIPIVDNANGTLGVRFQGGFTDLPGDGASDALVTFTVMSFDDFFINGARLQANTNIIGPPGATGFVGITETFLPGVNNVLLEVFDLQPGLTRLIDSSPLAPTQKLDVQKDILLISGDANSVATLSFVDQLFREILVPEPTSATLLLIAMGMALTSRRSKS